MQINDKEEKKEEDKTDNLLPFDSHSSYLNLF